MTIRVLFCAGSLEGGGSERQLWQLASHLPQSQFQCEFFLINRTGTYLERLPGHIPVHAWQPQTFSSPRIPGSIHYSQVKQLRSIIQRRQIDIVYDRGFHSTLISAPACQRAPVRRISVVVSPPSRDFHHSPQHFRSLKYYRLKQAYSDPSATTIAVSPSVASDISEYFNIPENQIITLSNPVDYQSINELASVGDMQNLSNRRPNGPVTDHSPTKNFRIVIVGRMTAEKGHLLLLEAVRLWKKMEGTSRIQEITVQVIGDGPLKNQLMEMSRNFEIHQHIQWLGFQQNPYPLMAAADMVCIPSQYEGSPNVALEAMALGTPVVVSPIAALVQLIGDDNQRGLILSDRTPASIADGILQIMKYPEIAAHRANIARQWVIEQHDFRQWLGRMQQLITAASKGHSETNTG